MPDYPIEPDKLLDAAERLAPARVGRGRPSYTAHRRAASTAYYAVFHAITGRVATLAFPDAGAAVQRRVRRWVAHADIAVVCRWVSGCQSTPSHGVPAYISALLVPSQGASNIDTHPVTIADGFLDLQEKRLEGDYDHEAVFTRSDTLATIALARQIVSLVARADSSSVKIFFGLVAMKAQVQSR